MKLHKLLTLFCLINLLSCNKDDSPSNNNPNPDPNVSAFAENFGSEIHRNFLGTVIDKNHHPIEGATITIGSATAQTDANGVFIISDATIHERFGYVKVEKAGYLQGSRSVVPTTGTNKVSIMLLEENVVGTTNSGTSETIALPNGASVALEGDYINEDGTAYSGSVNVVMHHLDPADDDMQDQMPGMLYAANAQNEERMLQTFGMLAVELKGSGGETLNLANGSSAEIKMPLDASLVASAPTTIPLWHFDETNGYWLEDGQATLVGNAYVGMVTHFSFWNCDIPAEAITLCVNFIDANDNLISNLWVSITSQTYGTRNGQTSNEGNVCGFVPSNETLTINTSYSYYSYCSNSNTNSIYTASIGPFTEDTTLDIIIPNNSLQYITETIVGNFTECDGDLINEGYVMLFSETGITPLDFDFVDNGSFELTTVRCSNSSNIFRLTGNDYVNTQQTDTLSFTYTSPITNIVTIAACNSVEEFITYQIDDHQPVTYNFNINVQLTADGLFINNNQNGTNNNFGLGIPEFDGVGVYNIVYFDFSDENEEFGNVYSYDITINTSAFGPISEYTDINFTGTFLDSFSITHTITGTLHVIRDN